jgi:hypothetical protein
LSDIPAFDEEIDEEELESQEDDAAAWESFHI